MPETPISVVATGEPLAAEAVLVTGESRYRSRADSSLSLRVRREQSAPGAWTVSRWLQSGPEAHERLVNQQRYVITPRGLCLAEQIDHAERVEVVFDPPMLLLPSTMLPGQREEQALQMVVHPLGDRSRVRARGEARSTVDYLGDQAVDGQDGSITAALIRHRLTATLGAARVDNTTDQWLLPEHPPKPEDGSKHTWRLIAERRTEQTRVLGLQTRDNRESWVELPSPSAPATSMP